MRNNQLKEYECLRSEIMKHIDLHNSLLTFAITTTVAILTFALSEKIPVLCLIPFCIIIPMSMRLAYYRSAMMKVAAYIFVFIEKEMDGLEWESANVLYASSPDKSKNTFFRKITSIRYYECFILGLICYFFYVLNYLDGKELCFEVVVNVAWPVLLIAWELLVTIRINSTDKEKAEWIQNWTQVKEHSSETVATSGEVLQVR